MKSVRRGTALGAVVALTAGAMLLAGGAPSGAAPQSQTFTFTGAPELFAVPAGVHAITVDAFGASGGAGVDTLGGLGGRATAVVCVTPGETLQVNVGGVGGDGVESDAVSQGDSESTPSEDVGALVVSAGGFNGGGASGDGSTPGGGGGGASDVRRGPYGLEDRLIVAGGGGGGGGADNEAEGDGGAGGGLEGTPGEDSVAFEPGSESIGGGGGTQTTGGAGGTNDATAEDGAFGVGGAGGEGDEQNDTGGGGGGGWYGGGGGGGDVGEDGDDGAGGGGGSGFGPTGVVFETGVSDGDGELTISWDPDADPGDCLVVRFTG
jgi:hypothetical protein